MAGLAASVIALAVSGIQPDIGVLAFAFGAVLALAFPASGEAAVGRIDWSTVFMVGGIVTFVGVLQNLGAVDMLGRSAMNVGTPLVAALVICMTAAIVSAFASTTGILAALVPLAVPLAISGGVSDWVLDQRAQRVRIDCRRLTRTRRRGRRSWRQRRTRNASAPGP